MDNLSIPPESQQYQQYYHQYQQPQQDSTASHAYDPSTQAYYASYQYYNQTPQQQQEPQHEYSYYCPDYSTSYQSHHLGESSSIQPAGVPIPGEIQQTHAQSHPNVYYNDGFVNPQQHQSQNGYLAPSHSAFAARANRGGKPVRGRGKGGRHGSSRGRGRGRGRGWGRGTSTAPRTTPGFLGQVTQPPSLSIGPAPAPPSRTAWCEICKVDCNTTEILEQHRNGKKHKRNLKVYKELQNLQNPQTQVLDSKPEHAQLETKEEGSNCADKPETYGCARGGLKRKKKGGRGGKLMRSNDGSRKPVEPPKPKQVAPLFCELCNVKCESQVVFDSHMAGKKHLANAKRFQGHQAAIGGSKQALHPPIQNVPDQQGGVVPDPRCSQAALVELLGQHGIHDAQTLLAQLVPFLLTQVLPSVATLGAPGSGPVVPDQPNSGTQVSELPTSDAHNPETTVELPPTKTNVSTEQADAAGREKSSVAGSENSCERDEKAPESEV